MTDKSNATDSLDDLVHLYLLSFQIPQLFGIDPVKQHKEATPGCRLSLNQKDKFEIFFCGVMGNYRKPLLYGFF
jgi:hypothetical protein